MKNILFFFIFSILLKEPSEEKNTLYDKEVIFIKFVKGTNTEKKNILYI